MSAYFLFDGQNELGPFSLEILQQQKLKRNTPIRLQGSDKWIVAEKVDGLKDLVRPTKIKAPEDVVPVLTDAIAGLHQRKPLLLYGALLGMVLLLSLSIYTSGRPMPPKKNEIKPVVRLSPVNRPVTELPLRDTVKAVAAVQPVPEAAKPVVKAPAEIDKTKAARANWRKTIKATNSNYGIGVLGGIKGLEVIFNNQSAFMVDEAIAKITYIKANGEEWKSVFASTYGIHPHDSKSVPVDDVARGKKVQISLFKVVSRKMKFFYQEGQKITNYADPYLLNSAVATQ